MQVPPYSEYSSGSHSINPSASTRLRGAAKAGRGPVPARLYSASAAAAYSRRVPRAALWHGSAADLSCARRTSSMTGRMQQHIQTHTRARTHTRTHTHTHARTHAHAPRGREKALGALLGLTYNTLNQHAFRCALLQRQRQRSLCARRATVGYSCGFLPPSPPLRMSGGSAASSCS